MAQCVCRRNLFSGFSWTSAHAFHICQSLISDDDPVSYILVVPGSLPTAGPQIPFTTTDSLQLTSDCLLKTQHGNQSCQKASLGAVCHTWHTSYLGALVTAWTSLLTTHLTHGFIIDCFIHLSHSDRHWQREHSIWAITLLIESRVIVDGRPTSRMTSQKYSWQEAGPEKIAVYLDLRVYLGFQFVQLSDAFLHLN